MYPKIEILKKQRAAAAIVLVLNIILIFKNVMQDNIISFNLINIIGFLLWSHLLIIQEEEAKKEEYPAASNGIRE